MEAELELTRLTLDDLPERLLALAAKCRDDLRAKQLKAASDVIKGWQKLPTHRTGTLSNSRDAERVLCSRSPDSWTWLINAAYEARAFQASTVITLQLEKWEREQQKKLDAPHDDFRAAAIKADVERLKREESSSEGIDRRNALVEFIHRSPGDDDATWHWKQEQKALRLGKKTESQKSEDGTEAA